MTDDQLDRMMKVAAERYTRQAFEAVAALYTEVHRLRRAEFTFDEIQEFRRRWTMDWQRKAAALPGELEEVF